MECGTLYLKHVRGSYYAFSFNKIHYKLSNGHKIYSQTDQKELIEILKSIRKGNSGRFYVNENKEIVTYCKTGFNEWKPYYVGALERPFVFEEVDNDPKDLQKGMLWPGFNRHHGSKYVVKRDGLYFFETVKIKKYKRSSYFIETTQKFPVENFDEELRVEILQIKGEEGSIRITENGHIWTAVTYKNLQRLFQREIVTEEIIREQIRSFTTLQKFLIDEFTRPDKYNRTWYPIYIGKYDLELEVQREDEPHIIYGKTFKPSW